MSTDNKVKDYFMNKHEIKGYILEEMKHIVVIVGQRTSDMGEYPLDIADNMANAAYAVLNQHMSTFKKKQDADSKS